MILCGQRPSTNPTCHVWILHYAQLLNWLHQETAQQPKKAVLEPNWNIGTLRTLKKDESRKERWGDQDRGKIMDDERAEGWRVVPELEACEHDYSRYCDLQSGSKSPLELSVERISIKGTQPTHENHQPMSWKSHFCNNVKWLRARGSVSPINSTISFHHLDASGHFWPRCSHHGFILDWMLALYWGLHVKIKSQWKDGPRALNNIWQCCL